MIITKEMSIQDLKDAFNKLFPYLKLEAYEKEHDIYQGSPADEQYPAETKLVEIIDIEYPTEIVVSPVMTVALLEEIFEEMYELHVQVFRKSGKQWIQTINTDSKTLGALNETGFKSVTEKTQII